MVWIELGFKSAVLPGFAGTNFRFNSAHPHAEYLLALSEDELNPDLIGDMVCGGLMIRRHIVSRARQELNLRTWMQLNPDLIPPVDTDITRGTKNQCLPSKPGQGLQLFLPLFYLLEQQRQKFDPTKPPPKNGDLRGCHWPAHSEGSVNTSRNLLSSFYPVINKDWLGIIWRHPHYPSFMDMHPFWIVINNLGKFGRTCGATSQIMPIQHTPYCAPQNQTLRLDFEILYQSDSV